MLGVCNVKTLIASIPLYIYIGVVASASLETKEELFVADRMNCHHRCHTTPRPSREWTERPGKATAD